MKEKRENWASRLGFLLASAGSAIGLGNLWGFPYKLGKNGGFAYLLVYLLAVAAVGCVIMLAEFALGRRSGKSPVGAYRALDRRFAWNGWVASLAPFIILTFYSVLGGWSLKYFLAYAFDLLGGSPFAGMSGSGYFSAFISSWQSVFFHAVFMALCALVLYRGVAQGLERACKLMMPGLFALLLVVIVRSVTLPGAAEGLKFMFKPDFSAFRGGGFGKVLAAALTQMFFSLSLGMGVLITYGSYTDKKTNLVKSALCVPLFDTLAAVLAGVAIMPAVFAFGLDPASGPSLLYITLYDVFESMAFGPLFGMLFYALVFFAAFTSAISLLENSVAHLVDETPLRRKKAVVWVGLCVFALGVPSALGYGPWAGVTLPTLTGEMLQILDWVDYVGEYIMLTLGSLALCVMVGWVSGPEALIQEIEQEGAVFRAKRLWSCMLRYVTPLLIAFTFLCATGVLPL